MTGGLDSEISLFNTQTRKIVAKLSGHSKRVNDVAFHPTDDLIFSCSQDRTVRVWQNDGESYTASHLFRAHTDEVVGISLHATGDYLASASHDKSWAFHDIRSGTTLTKIQDPTVSAGFSSISFHPDGLILGTGTKDNVVRIWDIKAQTNVATFEGHTAPVEGLSFSENGYHLATAGGDSVKLWDLRKLTNFHNIPLAEVHSVAFDLSGQYLIVSHGNSVRYSTPSILTITIPSKKTNKKNKTKKKTKKQNKTKAHMLLYSIYGGKSFTPIKTFSDSNAKVTDSKFGKDSCSFATTSLDRSLKLYG